MKILIEIPDNEIPQNQEMLDISFHFIDGTICECDYPFMVLPNIITDEQISDAFQLAIANYWESKSKYLTPPPTPCNCPIKKEAENENSL